MDEKQAHWTEEKEAIKSNKPLKLLLRLFGFLPGWLVRSLIYPVSFFYLICSKRARYEARAYQKRLHEYTNGKSPKLIRGYRQILSFSLCVLEKMQGWLGQIKFNKIHYQNDDIEELIGQLRNGQGAILITSHLGNMELMRSLQDYNTQLCSKEIPVYVIMEKNVTEQFNKTIEEINPKSKMNVIDSANIGPETIFQISEAIENGGLVVVAADRTSAHTREKVIRRKFLGELAEFPYGAFLIPCLVKCPVYYMFGLRQRTTIFNPQYNIYIEKSAVNLDCGRAERDSCLGKLCEEFVAKIEKYCAMYPYQWYNFHNFWLLSTDEKGKN